MITINTNFLDQYINKLEYSKIIENAKIALNKLTTHSGIGNEFTGWVDYEKVLNQKLIDEINGTAKKLSSISDYIISIGIGGSYLGAKALLDSFPGNEKVIFAGNNISPYQIKKLFKTIENKDFSIIVISKSGTTTETSIIFRLFKEKLIEKYGIEKLSDRIVAVTDKQKGALVKTCEKYNIKKFIIPDNIGGRFSVFTPVGLLPLAAAGHDINIIYKTIVSYIGELKNNDDSNIAIKYASLRYYLYKHKKYKTEYLITYDEPLRYIIEWWKQLFGESEGKDKVGLMPSGAVFTTDLHSIGQYLQEGERILFETVLNINKYDEDFIIPEDKDNFDNFNDVAHKPISEIQKIAFYSTTIAHSNGDVPIIILNLTNYTLSTFTKLMLFFMFSCGISGYLLGINPFNQPGVESYKANMKALMFKDKKYEKLKNEINDKIEKLF